MLESAQPRLATILVVDDEPLNRELIRAMLGSDYRVVQADRGSAALAAMEREPVDLVLLDVMMPGENGFEVCRRIKATPSGPFVPVILVTALDGQERRNAGLEAGAEDFLSKPIDRRELLLRVRSFLRIRDRGEELRNQVSQLERTQGFKDDLVALLVHDMRSPLAAAIAWLELIKEDLEPGAPMARDLDQVLQANLRLATILEEALHVRLLEDGVQRIERTPVDLRKLLAETVTAFRAIAVRTAVALESRYEGEPVAALDGKLVRRSVDNLLSNAIKYTPAGGTVDLRVTNAADEVRIEVSDCGPGIPDALKDSMFEKFGSVEAASGAPRKGFGLGLYLVQLVTRGHRGEASVKDRPGGGAVFTLILRTAA